MLNFERGHAAFGNGQVGPGLLWMVKSLAQSAIDAEDPAWKHTALANLSAWLPVYPRLRAVLSHAGPVKKVAFSPDGKRILTGSKDKYGATLGYRHRPADRSAHAASTISTICDLGRVQLRRQDRVDCMRR